MSPTHKTPWLDEYKYSFLKYRQKCGRKAQACTKSRDFWTVFWKRSLQSIHLNAKIRQKKFRVELFLNRIFIRFSSSMVYFSKWNLIAKGESHTINNFKQKIAIGEKAGAEPSAEEENTPFSVSSGSTNPWEGCEYLLLTCIISSNFICHIHDNPRMTHDNSCSRSAFTDLPMAQSLQSMKDQDWDQKLTSTNNLGKVT